MCAHRPVQDGEAMCEYIFKKAWCADAPCLAGSKLAWFWHGSTLCACGVGRLPTLCACGVGRRAPLDPATSAQLPPAPPPPAPTHLHATARTGMHGQAVAMPLPPKRPPRSPAAPPNAASPSSRACVTAPCGTSCSVPSALPTPLLWCSSSARSINCSTGSGRCVSWQHGDQKGARTSQTVPSGFEL